MNMKISFGANESDLHVMVPLLTWINFIHNKDK